MKKKIFLIGLSAFLLCGCGKIPKLSNGEDAIVTFKDDEKISVNAFYEEIKNTYGMQTLINMIDKYIYETEFKDEKKNASEYAKSYVDGFRKNFESDTEMLNYLKSYYNMQTIEAFQDAQYLAYLQNHAIETYVTGKITEDELKKFYETDVYPDMSISHILITPAVKDTMTDKEKKEEEDKAKEKIENIIKELQEAEKKNEDINEKFSNLAKEYSEDSSTKNNGGSLGKINIGSLSSKYDELVVEASKLENNKFSTKLITTELGYHVILKTETDEKKTYDESIDTMKKRIMNNKLSGDNAQSLIIEAIKDYRKEYDMNIVDSEIDSQYGKYMNNLINANK